MSLVGDMVVYLKAQTPLSNVVSARVYPVARTQGDALPAILVRRVGGNHGHQMSGGAGYNDAVVEVVSCGGTYKAATDLADLIRAELQGYGSASSQWNATTTVFAVTLTGSEVDDYDPTPDGAAMGTFLVAQQYTVKYIESIPTPT